MDIAIRENGAHSIGATFRGDNWSITGELGGDESLEKCRVSVTTDDGMYDWGVDYDRSGITSLTGEIRGNCDGISVDGGFYVKTNGSYGFNLNIGEHGSPLRASIGITNKGLSGSVSARISDSWSAGGSGHVSWSSSGNPPPSAFIFATYSF